ncbi:15989_t:CDS:2 [Dentiscutata heterogama]|uniref:15989_t:CDS:1 n=1 Tax=Dentiscutata heterogama TaxID=1316150 RepID=A0ACA9NUT4_9GLOM|nr:15989_t:CDS:2 [Dentiscutata heterogama]
MKTETFAIEISIEQSSKKVESTMMEFTLMHANDRTDDYKNITSTELTSMEVTHTQTNKPEDVNDPEIEIEYLNTKRKRNFIEKDSVIQPQGRLPVMNMNKKAESSNTYNTGKAKLAEHEISELQEFDTNNTVPVSQLPISINTKPRKKKAKERTKPQADNFT